MSLAPTGMATGPTFAELVGITYEEATPETQVLECRVKCRVKCGVLLGACASCNVGIRCHSFCIGQTLECVMRLAYRRSPPPIPGRDPKPTPDPEPQPGSEPDVVPPVNPEPGSTPDVVQPEPELIPV
jgi:hypothetical protein